MSMKKRTLPIDHSVRSIFMWAPIFAAIVGLMYYIALDQRELYLSLVQEGESTELLTAIFYLVSGVLLIMFAFRERRAGQRWVTQSMPILLGLFFIFIAGEEESWGMWQLGFEVPEEVAAKNYQNEINLHNLDVLKEYPGIGDSHRILNICMLLLGLILPTAYRFVPLARNLANRLQFPVSPLCLTAMYILPMVYEKATMAQYDHWGHPEAREFMFSIAILLYGVSVYRRENVLPDQ